MALTRESLGRPSRFRAYSRVSLRTALVLVVIVGVWSAWLVQSARAQRRAVRAIESAYGGVWYEWQWQNGAAVPNGKPWWPKWLIDCLGIDVFCNVVAVDGSIFDPGPGRGGPGALLSIVSQFRRLQDLTLPYDLPLDDQALARLRGLKYLTSLDLEDMDITDPGLEHLSGLTGLRSLNLGLTQVTDAGLACLRGLTLLEELDLRKTEISDAGLIHLKGMTKLRVLNLAYTDVSDEGLVHLQHLSRMQILDLGGTKVTDFGVSDLRRTLKKAKIPFNSLRF